jgi:hypothetical protein
VRELFARLQGRTTPGFGLFAFFHQGLYSFTFFEAFKALQDARALEDLSNGFGWQGWNQAANFLAKLPDYRLRLGLAKSVR